MEDNKIISRPKVRFSQFSDNVQNKETIEYCQKKTILCANGPKIRDIVSLKKPIRIVDFKKSTGVHNKDTLLSNCNTEISTHCNNTTSENIQSISLPSKNMPEVGTSKILRNTNDIQNIRGNCNILQSDKHFQGHILQDCEKNLQHKGKENKDITLKKAVSNKSINKITTGDSQHIQSVIHKRFKLSVNNNNVQKVNTINFKNPKMMKLQSVPNIMKKTKNQVAKRGIFNVKSITPNVMPCYKTVIKNKVSPVKKSVLRNISDSKIKTFVGPGISCKRQNNAKIDDAKKKSVIIFDVAAEESAQPKYNSIMCTINKLKELEQQKIVTDIDHLPSAQKGFLKGKISTVLDFPLGEVIYKNLVDLSIDENQLPSLITRSKDPEPRQKDITPKLSDFFRPKDIKEICESMHIKPRILKVDENWNAFKISDKILEWKYNMDDIE